MATPGAVVGFRRQRGLAPDGRCKSFGAARRRHGHAEGAGVVLLERLSDAQRNGHQVLAVVRGSAVNQDGASNGLTAPNGPSQQRVIRAALAGARLAADRWTRWRRTARDGAGRPDRGAGAARDLRAGPAEAAAVAGVGEVQHRAHPGGGGRRRGDQDGAGAAARACCRRRCTPAEPSPHVDWSAGAVSLLAEPVPWPAGGERPRRAGISSFGISGTNAHVDPGGSPRRTPQPAGTRRMARRRWRSKAGGRCRG